MKKYFILVLILTAAASCKKGNNIQASTSITGKWELRNESGGFAGILNYSAGNGTTLQFNSDSTFTQYQSFKLLNQGTFSVVKNGGVAQGGVDELYFNHKAYNVMQLKADTLIIGTSIADGLQDTYVRQ